MISHWVTWHNRLSGCLNAFINGSFIYINTGVVNGITFYAEDIQKQHLIPIEFDRMRDSIIV